MVYIGRTAVLASIKADTATRLVTSIIKVISIIDICMQGAYLNHKYGNRDDFNYRSYKPSSGVGFYAGEAYRSINIDYVASSSYVSLDMDCCADAEIELIVKELKRLC